MAINGENDECLNNIFSNKLKGKIVGLSIYIVAIAKPIAAKDYPTINYAANNEDESDYSDYNFRAEAAEMAANAALNQISHPDELIEDELEITDAEVGEMLEAQTFNSVESLSDPVKHEAIRLAHEILNKLKLKFSNSTIDSLSKADDMPAVKSLMNGIAKVALTFNHHLEIAEKIAPHLLDDEDVSGARDVLGIFKYHGKKTQIRSLEEDLKQAIATNNSSLIYELTHEINKLKVEAATMPEKSRDGGEKKIGDLLEKIEVGMDKLAQKMQEMTQAGVSGTQTGRDLGIEDNAANQGKQSTMDLSKANADVSKNIDNLNKQIANLQRVNQAIQAIEKNNKEQAGQTQQQANKEQKETQQSREERQQRRARRQERAQQRLLSQQQVEAQLQEKTQQRQQRQEARQQRIEARQVQTEQKQEQVRQGSIAEELRQMRLKQKAAADALNNAHPTPHENTAAAKPIISDKAKNEPAKTENIVQPNAPKLDPMQSLLSNSGMNPLQTMAAMQNMEVPDALKPNSPARMIKAITQQKEAEERANNPQAVDGKPTVPNSDLPILIKQNQTTR